MNRPAHRFGWFTDAEEAHRADLTAHLAAELRPHLDGWEEAGHIPLRQILKGMAAGGFLGRRHPFVVGGGGGSGWDHVVLAECLGGLGSESVAMSVTVHNDMVAPLIADEGSPEAVERFLLPALQGEHVLAHAVSEPGAGSDIAAVRSLAERVPGGYVVTGTKRWLVAGCYADSYAVLARLPEPRPPFGYVMLMVPRDADGVEVVPGGETLGLRAAGVAEELRLHGVRVPDSARLGGHGLGLVMQIRQFESERIISACRALATAERLLDETRRHTQERETFGAPLASRQAVAFRLAALRSEVDACRQLAYEGIDRWLTGRGHQAHAAAVKLTSSRLVRAVAETCLHLLGAHGQRADHPMNRAWRDTRLLSISTGSDEMMLTTIARGARWTA